MDSSIVLLLNIVGGSAGYALFVYVLYRVVLAAKKSSGGQIVGMYLMLLGSIVAPAPAREVSTETRQLKRKQDESGDPPNSGAD